MPALSNGFAGDLRWPWLLEGEAASAAALAVDELQYDLAGATTIARDALAVNLCSAAALAWVVYDMILCFGREVPLVWGRWKEPKGRHTRRLYVLVRYFSVMNLAWYVGVNTSFDITPNLYASFYVRVLVLNSTSITAAKSGTISWSNATAITLLPDAMILIRVNAVYNWSVTTLVLTISLFITQMVTSLVIGFLTVVDAPVIPPMRGLQRPGCVLAPSLQHSKIALAAWIPSIAVQTIYFILMLKTLLHLMRGLDKKGASRINWENWIEVKRLVPTMVVFIKHGVAYFVFGTLIKVVNAVFLVGTAGPLQMVGVSWMMALYPIVMCRIYLSMVDYLHSKRHRRRHHLHANGHTETGTEEDVDFTFNPQDEPPAEDLGRLEFARRSRGSCEMLEIEGPHMVEFGDEEY
ncbi:hypothetical protein NLJ89_g6353 [Agrocybe chaxingu]|uniref:DUF6533 domain-containing protein n=1 Tax=Agrocybe chaxingu TaxID=84603 RepID=A0A9W8MU51_9AGAR|nr:hypothetical protein NLJ89_g6353 [Agrocybe chaxingu]